MPAKTKAELREMLAEAVRNTQPQPEPKPEPKPEEGSRHGLSVQHAKAAKVSLDGSCAIALRLQGGEVCAAYAAQACLAVGAALK
jgi:hypothetical protein